HATPVIGIGGISSGEDAAKYLLCGAQAMQVGTALSGNPERLGEIATELGHWMERKNYATLNAFRGNALEWLP
ncbi:MAG: diguanylate cyclase, partial [Euryarchaeota archaeon]|nr:diguanylate cyclase [Euryarchaeota archaeon]